MVRTLSGWPSPLLHLSQLALCRNTVRSNSEPRRISPVSDRRSRSFLRARRACSCVIFANDTDSASLPTQLPTAHCIVHGDVARVQLRGGSKKRTLLQFRRFSATEF